MWPLRTLRSLRRRLLLHRRPLAALAAAGAVLVGLQVAAPTPTESVGVWTVKRALPSGALLERADLVRGRFAPGTVPDEAITTPGEVVGRRLAAPMSRGEVVTRLRTVSSELLRGYPGTVAVPLRISDAEVVDLLRVGDRVSIVAGDPEGRASPRLLADDVAVVAIPAGKNTSFSAASPGRLIVAAVPTPISLEVATWSVAGYLSIIWDR